MALIAALVALDQIVKWLVERALPMHEKVDLLPFLALFRTHNEGIAFSLLSGLGENWLIVITLVIIAVVGIIWARSSPTRWLSQIGFAFVIAGAIGNLIDRAMYGYVVDYVLFSINTWSFAVFNLADAFITVGAAAIIIDEVFGKWLYPAEAI
nr:signal peptidase II [Flavimaribacter sediminis]